MPTPTSDLVLRTAERYAAVRERVAAAATAAGRHPEDIRILAATKTQDAPSVRAAVLAGAHLIGENRVQELVAKAPDLADLTADGALEVHMIGHLQKNKINQVLATATCVESLDSLDLAEALATRCERDDRVLDVMLQVNVSGEESKSGVDPDDASWLAWDIATLPGLRLVGFMTVGANSPDQGLVRAGYARLRAIRDKVLTSGVAGTEDAHELSMGMSQDLEVAIAEGATIVRVGTAIFGPRPPLG